MEKDLKLHPEAESAYGDLVAEISKNVKARPNQTSPSAPSQIFPVAKFNPADIIGPMKWVQQVTDGYHQEIGRFWPSGNAMIGWDGDDFKRAKGLASRLAKEKPYKGLLGEKFILDELFGWMRSELEGNQALPFVDFLAKRASEEVETREIWVPLHATYAKKIFSFGQVTFRTLTPEVMEAYYSRFKVAEPAAVHALKSKRSKLQGSLVGCVVIRAEGGLAEDLAHALVEEATALLRFLSEANWTAQIRSFVLPLGLERHKGTTTIRVSEGKIKGIDEATINEGPTPWNVDRGDHFFPGILDLLSRIAADHTSTEFRRSLYDALLLHAKNSVTTDPAEKLVFVLVALESMLLKDANEPIQGNLAERMAFLVGDSLDDRKKIVSTVREIYRVRSKYIHHGKRTSEDEVLQEFLWFAWQTLSQLLLRQDKVESRAKLLAQLDDRRLS